MNLGATAKHVLGTVAPTILTAIGGPFGALAGAALAAALGTSDEKGIDTSLVGASQDTLLKVKQAEIDFQAKLAELGIDEEKLGYDDKDSARKREEVVKDSTPHQLAWVIIGGFLFSAVGIVVASFIWPERAKAIVTGEAGLMLGTIIGYLSSQAKEVTGYYFGSSLGSKQKDEAISTLSTKRDA